VVINLGDLKCEGRVANCIVEIANRDVYKLKRVDFREETQKFLINFMIIRGKIVPLHQNNKLHLFQIIIYTLIYSLIFVR
jgi:hypothetical protein